MNIEELINSKSKAEAAFIIYSDCILCHQFCEDKYGVWKCISPWHEAKCRNNYEKFLEKKLDKNTYFSEELWR